MQWMISHQDARRNLSPGELIYANSMVAEEIALENKKKKEKANEQFYGNRFTENKESVESTPIGVQSKSRSNTWTDSQTAKKAGVGIGTVARYNRVMNSDDEDIQTKEFTPILKYDILSYPIQNISVNDDVVQIEDESFHIGDVANIFVGYYGKDGRKRYLEDKYILYIIYVLIERYKKKYGSENEYVRIYKGLKQKGKITPATIDKWFGGKITAKALDRLEKYKYIKREQRERYDKIYLCDIPTEEASEAQFMAESFNPLLDLWESNGDRKVGKCEICGKKFVVVGNSKTCSVKCSKILVKKNKNKQ